MGSMKHVNSLLRTQIQTKSFFRAQPLRKGDDIKVMIKASGKRLSVEPTEARRFAQALMEVSRHSSGGLLSALQASAVEVLDAVRIAERG